ncbi:MAG: protein translocase subunit SecF [Ktedonobacterales bacterium]|nr:protein translocase subunit SecF [Ktedonobacterales bacterium]
MYQLTRYKYWFFGISLAIILPGVLALAVWGLNLGIDFTGGSSIQMGFASNTVTTTQVAQFFRQAGAKDVQVYSGTNLNGGIAPHRYVYIMLNHSISKDEVAQIIQRLSDPKANLPANPQAAKTYYSVTYPGSKDTRALIVVLFGAPVTSPDAVKNALQNLPPTGPAPVVSDNSQAQPTATPSATATSTPGASTSGGNATSTSATSPVSVESVRIGQNNQIYTVNTQTAFHTGNTTAKGYVDLDRVLYTMDQQLGPAYVQTQSNIGPSIANETTRNAFFAVLAASLAIMIYIGIAFRHIGSFRQALRFGASAIIALLHDALVVLGLWAIFGHFFDFKVDSLFLTAILTVIGFSVHDTIVVFDRIRENMSRRTSESFEMIVNTSLVQTMSRSLNTSLTVLFTLAALTLFGGVTIREFTLALLIGIMSGTYSSIFNASMFLTVWETREYRRWFRRKPAARTPTPARRELAGTRA